MSEELEKIKIYIARFKEKNPAYNKILDFYENILEDQEAHKPKIISSPIEITKDFRTLQIKEGFPLINKDDFVIDVPSSVSLFKSLCKTSKNANEKLKENILSIEDALESRNLNIEKILEEHDNQSYLDKISNDIHLDKSVLQFLIHMSIKPSIIANAEMLKDQIDLKNWLRGYCPLCGSLPQMSELKGEGQRYYLCSYCSFKWPSERLKCPFCENKDHKSLHYFYEEGQEIYRVDVCDKCRQYIKTVDSRKLNYEPDLNLEDIVTIHLDIVASEKGFKRPAPSLWGF